ncbi:hypothetical protein DOTSEDRAFT_75550 [Dothistroma septosporum NZE10]|uniref:LPXTG-domain-containing protein n=1 Tax=Dothistroma septosporum (strain NZE10 / CBS 128990) TaxID=675120 RepID=M2YJ04_DOTSN|nr:hypothetical protein DOTSEDRAFT_75550 [Dothistroma septosporum NZE10]
MSAAYCYVQDVGTGPYNGTQYGGYMPCASGPDVPGLYDAQSNSASCCRGNDICGADSTCKSATPPNNTAGDTRSGFYIGGYTDPDYRAVNCRLNCRTLEGSSENIVWVESMSIWACCGRTPDGSHVNCSNPLLDQELDLGWTLAQFPGPLASDYRPPIATTVTSSAIASSTASSTRPSTSTPTASSLPSGLSTGAKAGIGVGVALGVLALTAGAVLLLSRRRRATRRHPAVATLNARQDVASEEHPKEKKERTSLMQYEAENTSHRAELDTPHRTHELSA